MADGKREEVEVAVFGGEGRNVDTTMVVSAAAFVWSGKSTNRSIFIGDVTLSTPFRPRSNHC